MVQHGLVGDARRGSDPGQRDLFERTGHEQRGGGASDALPRRRGALGAGGHRVLAG